jgi:guanylate kinase
MVVHYSGSLFIVAAPSGGGKTSLVKKLVHDDDHTVVSVSHTTRSIRPGERHGVDYFFVDEREFMEMVERGAFLEHAQVFNHFYGTSMTQITDRLQAGIDVVLDIDWQGAEQIRHVFSTAVSVFILPPSLEALKQRLCNRQQDNAQTISSRMQCARDELSHYAEFDYLIVNDDFEQAAAELKAIVTAHRLSRARQAEQQKELLSFLLSPQ